jgi:Initiator Replication protein
MQSNTLSQRTNHEGFPKPGELIEITGGSHQLEASDRSILNILYQHAHDSGRLADASSEWEVPLPSLRFSHSHKGSERVRDSLDRLMRVIVTVPYLENSEERILKTHLLDFVDLTANEASSRATVRFGIPKKLQPILLNSSRWGRIKAEIVCAMTSKYAIALYELIQLRSHMDRCIETFPIERFRELLGVPPLAYSARRSHQLIEKVIAPALLEVNGLSDMGVAVEVNRKSPRAPIETVSVSWWRKTGEEFRAALRERDRSKIGRMARLGGHAETITEPLK